MIRSLTRKAGKRIARPVISPKIRANAIREVNRAPYFYRGTFRGLEFVLYRKIGEICLLIRNERNWKTLPAANVWAALDTVEQERNHHADTNVAADER